MPKLPTTFSAQDTFFRKVWQTHAMAIFEVSHLGSGPLYFVGPDDPTLLTNKALWTVFDSFAQAKDALDSIPPPNETNHH